MRAAMWALAAELFESGAFSRAADWLARLLHFLSVDLARAQAHEGPGADASSSCGSDAASASAAAAAVAGCLLALSQTQLCLDAPEEALRLARRAAQVHPGGAARGRSLHAARALIRLRR